MNLYKEHSNFLSKDSRNFIDNVLLGDKFPFFQIPSTGSLGKNIKDGLFNHLVLPRPEDRSITESITSGFHEPTVKILNEFSQAVKIKPYFYLRISYNLTYPNGFEKSGIHRDHDYDYKQIIIYLNDMEDKESKTVVLKNKKIIKEIKPKQYKGVCFDKSEHFNYNPKVGKRLVLIGTFI